jgi:hypothetical protein
LRIIFIAEFHSFIGPAIPGIVDSVLKVNHRMIRSESMNALTTFSQRGNTVNLLHLALLMIIIAELQNFFGPFIADIVNLLKDTQSSIRLGAARTLSGLFQQGSLSVFLKWHF